MVSTSGKKCTQIERLPKWPSVFYKEMLLERVQLAWSVMLVLQQNLMYSYPRWKWDFARNAVFRLAKYVGLGMAKKSFYVVRKIDAERAWFGFGEFGLWRCRCCNKGVSMNFHPFIPERFNWRRLMNESFHDSNECDRSFLHNIWLYLRVLIDTVRRMNNSGRMIFKILSKTFLEMCLIRQKKQKRIHGL